MMIWAVPLANMELSPHILTARAIHAGIRSLTEKAGFPPLLLNQLLYPPRVNPGR